jgi:hypothetical protein
VLEFADHLHENFLYPCSINKGRYNVPSNPVEGYRLCFMLIAQLELLTTPLPVALRCTSRASQSMSGQMGHIGQRQRLYDGKWIINYRRKAFYLYLVGTPIYLNLISHYLGTYVAGIRLLWQIRGWELQTPHSEHMGPGKIITELQGQHRYRSCAAYRR